ncbi:MAG: carboxypeptidase-like regulatory domain-containing protein [Acidobacteriaceae bacterium]
MKSSCRRPFTIFTLCAAFMYSQALAQMDSRSFGKPIFPAPPDPRVQAAIQQISPQSIQQDIASLVGFHNRSTLSSNDAGLPQRAHPGIRPVRSCGGTRQPPTVTSDSAGNYALPALQPGTYRLVVSAAGMRPRASIQIQVQQKFPQKFLPLVPQCNAFLQPQLAGNCYRVRLESSATEKPADFAALLKRRSPQMNVFPSDRSRHHIKAAASCKLSAACKS